jgi:drug/metabolite transporter (DMT)-like permease
VSIRVAFLTTLTLVAFAANSLLCRMALAPDLVDPVAFTSIRIGSGVAVLFPLSALMSEAPPEGRPPGSWGSGFALFVYAMSFSLAYVSLETGVGALILFGSVQATMIGAGLWQGERPNAQEWLGLLAAMGGLVYLVLPGMSAPNPVGAALMLASGIGWGVYSLRGRGSTAPIAATAGNFARALPLSLACLAIGWSSLHAVPRGIGLAVTSGAITSGLGYVVWYITLRDLTATRAAIVQLAVPVIAAAGGIVFLAEEPSLRLATASVMILGGVATATMARGRRTAALVRSHRSRDNRDQ